MPTKTNSMKNLIENALAITFGIISWFLSGKWLHVDLLQISWYEVFIGSLKLLQVALGGMLGMAGGLFGKKYFFPYIEKKIFRKKIKK